ncbi:amino acid adenylation domain-containing protein [Actinophytocola sp.]|uniref:amino acid adenylation domain-containing protein n=1 Tax=Actinophytocola sp. TaxID=1872138 RepID=UPI00389A737F
MTNLDDVVAAPPAVPATPAQRRLAGLIQSDGPEPYRTLCRVAVPGGLDEAGLRARAEPIIAALPQDASGGHAELTVADGVLTLELPAGRADETTAEALVKEFLGVESPRTDVLPYRAAAQWWDRLATAPDAVGVREFWRARAEGWDSPLPSVLCGQMVGTGGFTVRGVVADLDAGLVDRLRAGQSVRAWLVTAWQVLLRRQTGVTGLVLGVATDLRRHDELRDCRGPLTAYLPMRADTPLDAPITDHVQDAARQLREGGERAEWFDWPPGSADGFSFGFAHRVLPSWTTPSGPAVVQESDARGDRFALRLICQEHAHGLRLRLEYDPRLVATEMAEDLLAEFPALLDDGLSDPARPATMPKLVTPGIRDRLLAWGSGPVTHLPDGGLAAMVRATAEQHPEVVAVRDAGQSLTYRELVARMDEVAGHLADRGVDPEEPVAVHLHPGVDLLVTLLGVLAAGAAYVCLDPGQPADRTARLAAAASARLVITDGDVPAGLTPVPIDSGPVRRAATPVHLDALAYVLYTSGSTGAPKGVRVTHRGLVNYLTGIADDWPRAAVSLVSTSAAFDLTLPSLYLPLLSGGTVVFGQADPATLTDDLAHPYTLARATPTHLRAVLAELETGDGRRLATRRIAVGGEPLPAALAARWAKAAPSTTLLNYYGPTETVGARVRGPVDPDSAGPTGTIPLGTPIANTTLVVLGPDFELCPLGAVGELYIGGTGLARGYTGPSAETADRFVPDPWGPAGARLYRTGDLVRWLPGRRLEFVGRADDQVKVRGYRIEPAEVAIVLAGHPAVTDAVVVGAPDGAGDIRLVAYAVAEAGPVSTEDLRAYLGERLPAYMLPAALVWLDTLPVGPNGKLDRSALPEPGGQRPHQSVAHVAPRDDTEQVLADVWAETLGLERVGVHDNFYAIGGDSILSILVASRAAKRGLKVSLRDFFRHPTIAEMAPHVRPAGAVTGTGVAGHGLTPVQHWFFEQDLPHPGHWNQGWLLGLDTAPDHGALSVAVAAVAGHHPAFTSRFHADPAAPGGWRPERCDVAVRLERAVLPAEGWPSALAETLAGLQEFDVSTGPLLRVALIDGGPGLVRLAVIAHHLVIDAVSWQIFFEDLQMAYRQARAGGPVSLPPTTTAPGEWAAALATATGRAAADLDHWVAQSPADLRDLPVDHDAGEPRQGDRRVVEVVLDAERTTCLLRSMPRDVRVDYAITTAVALAIADWTGQRSVHLTVEGQGRAQDLVPGADLYRSVGWFTALAPMLVQLPGGDPVEALRSVRQQFHELPHDGLSYGVLRYLDPVHGPRLAARPQPRISVNYVGQTGGGARTTTDGLAFAPAPEQLPPLLHPGAPAPRLWIVNAVVRDDRLYVVVDYAGLHYEPETAHRVADGILTHLRRLVDAWSRDGGRSLAPAGPPPVGTDQRALAPALVQALARAPRRKG